MAVSNTTALELLGKVVSFEYSKVIHLTDQSTLTYKEKICGKIDAVVLTLSSGPQIAIDGGDFYSLSEINDFLVKPLE
ncbi:hypothetical protein [Acinetobacter soli]|uniref:hypothetical protein n=1 Tax=Acinetobacter soli TaxID=487316 RepID=UPI00125CA321|nr:hypothetical protein [Acinetobacter soli]